MLQPDLIATTIAPLLTSLAIEIDYAYQPIVDVHTGDAFGFEALLRGFERLHADSITAVFDRISEDDVVLDAELLLLDKALAGFTTFAGPAASRLFFNLNTRLLAVPPREFATRARPILARHGIPMTRLCLEISEHELVDASLTRELLDSWAGEAPLSALDDFGMGFSGLRMLAEIAPNLIKIDRFFVAGVDANTKQRTFLSQMVNLIHSTGLSVVAEGIETEEEFRVCRDVGCDFAQGFFIERPTTDWSRLQLNYPGVEAANRRNRRLRTDSAAEMRDQLDTVAPLNVRAPMVHVLDAFQANRKRSFFPIVNERGEPLGIVHEERLKGLIYSPFGRDLITSRVHPHLLRDYVIPCLVFDVNSSIDRILNAIGQRPDDHAVLIVEGGRYIGLLDARGIIRTMHDRLLVVARDQNPLTKLPGNVMVTDYIATSLEEALRPHAFVYFDFDYFKPFNDRFGFRQGDRAIAMFADLMRSRYTAPDIFLGHIGGDDFFLGARGTAAESVVDSLPAFIAQFASDVESFYDLPSRRAGVVEAVARDGSLERIPLLSVSAACVVLETTDEVHMDAISARLAVLKRAAKHSPAKIATEIYVPGP